MLAACDQTGQASAPIAPTEKNLTTTLISSAVESPYAGEYQALGRNATTAEVAAWDIDVRPDFTGLPLGSGSVADGEELWLAKCAACHGEFGDSNKFFTPLVLGNVTDQDIESGHVAALMDSSAVRTTFMRLSTISTLWDYINRAMPWNAPKSLAPDEVYALVAYLLNLAYVVDGDFILSNENIAQVQAKLPNRNGMIREHGLWKVGGQPDVEADDCMSECVEQVSVTSFIPDYAKNAAGNLRDQMRTFGPFQGVDTGGGADTSQAPTGATAPTAAQAQSGGVQPPDEILASNGCLGCHQMESKLVGPAFFAVAEKYAGRADAKDYLSLKITDGSDGVWGGAMPPQSQVAAADVEQIAAWLAGE